MKTKETIILACILGFVLNASIFAFDEVGKEPIYYHQILDEYIKMRDYLKNCQLIADRNKDQRVIILRTKK